MKLLFTRSYHQSLKKLTPEDQKPCQKAVDTLCRNPRHPGLNLEHLGKTATHNHHSIRASKELRIILGVEPNLHAPAEIILAYAGHHDNAYAWSDQHGKHTDMATGTPQTDSAQKSDLMELQKTFASAEEWQLFLHPDQQALVHKKFFGETRILGAAGTGKTVLGLHRAAYLGKCYPEGKVLFTTYSRSLPKYLHDLYQGIPDAPPNVEFINVDRLARKLTNLPSINLDIEKRFFEEAWEETIPNTPLEKLSRDYLKEEIERVIKGRDATRDEYLNTDEFQRIGREQGFNRKYRKICWNLKEAWDAKLQKSAITTFADILIAARDNARQSGGEYRAVIVDEHQDLTLVGVQFLRALSAGDHSNPIPDDGLLFFGDAAQRIYAGGWRPVWANLKFTGRSETLQTNYRNTHRIIEAAIAVRGSAKTGADREEQITTYKDFPLGDGEHPVFFQVGKKMEIPTIAREIQRLIQDKALKYEDIGILIQHNKDAQSINDALRRKHFNIPCFLLEKMRKKPIGPGVRIGTFDRGKGMEFKAVFLPRLGASQFPGVLVSADPQQENIPNLPPESLSAEQQEHRQLQLDRLYVGMTRAVYFLYLLADEEPCEELQNAEHYFEWQRDS